MTNPSMPQMPGAGAMSDTLEFMKNLWGNVKLPGVSIPGMVMPSLSVEEINKQITDLKAVESWLTVNMNMLHGTIKALEVQSATISTLQSMSSNFSSAMQSATPKPAEESAPFNSPFNSPFSKPEPVAQPDAVPRPEFKMESKPEPELAPKHKTESTSEAVGGSSAAEQLPNPAVWWNMLQDQFKQAVAGAITPAQKDAPKAADKSKPAATARSTKASVTAKPAAKTSTKPTAKTAAKKSAAAIKSAAPRKA